MDRVVKRASAVVHNRQVIINCILIFITGRGGDYKRWVVGTSTDALGCLRNRHGVAPDSDTSIFFRAESPIDARTVKDFFVEKVDLLGDDRDDHAANEVYVYRMEEGTRP